MFKIGRKKGLNTLRLMLLPVPVCVSIAGGFVTTGCESAKASDQDSLSAFRYREVYLPEGMGKSARNLGLNTVEEDWGIWGHNLAKVLPDDFSNSVYAKVNGNTMKKQFCFSSNHLFDYISDYVDRKYDADEHVRFAIIPNDNDIVCLCEKCVAVGNTKGNASPAVTNMVRRLAKAFPYHIFFTSDYKTTRELPRDSMPENTGVLLSAIEFPLSAAETTEEHSFIKRIRDWKQTTPRILVWDYINNFDDYFTPFPMLAAMQRRLKDYRDNQVTAIFLNGSGSDLSSLSLLNTEVLSELTRNPDTDWRELLKEKAKEHYPVTGELIAEYMLAQEDYIMQNGMALPLYEGVAKAKGIYLPEDKFIEFHDNLVLLSDKATGKEKENLEILLGELALTRLELNRIKGEPVDSEFFMGDLQKLSGKGYVSYNESGWMIDDYIKDYNYLLKHYQDVRNRNRLKGVKLTAVTPLDPDYNDTSILTDGVLSIPSNYHNGHLIMSPETATSIMIPGNLGGSKLRVWLSYNTGYKIHLPEAVSLHADGMKRVTVNPEYPKDLSGHCPIEFDLPAGITGPIYLTFVRNPDTRSMGVEEIELF